MGKSSAGAELDAIEAVYRGRLADLRRVATAITGNREAAFDAVQDAFATAVRRRRQFRGEGSLDAWVWRIVVHSARDRVAADAARAARAAAASSTNGGTRSDGTAVPVRELVSLLPERQRVVLFLAYYAELDYATIAETLGISTGTVGATLNQARNSLRRQIEDFMMAFDSNLPPIVGQQVTLSREISGADVQARIDLLEARAAAGDCELVVREALHGRPAGFLFVPGRAAFAPDRAGAREVPDAELRAHAARGGALTFTAVPRGSGRRLGLDRDLDGILDGDASDRDGRRVLADLP